MKTQNKKIVALITSIALSSVSANAAITLTDTIAIDFGATVASTANYNHSTHDTNTGDVADLVRLSDGAATGVSLTMAGSSQDNINNVASDTLGNMTDGTIYIDGILANQNNDASGNPDRLTLTFAGLDDSLTYDLIGGLARAGTQGNIGNWTSVWSADGQSAPTNGFSSGAYVSFAGLSSTGGSLVITVVSDNQYAGISQLELTAVPEPSSTALLGLGGLALILRRRK
ncbi:MAG: PEP-CTERM sorting domain-containing protein [Akkermansiaceae bacterium]